MDWLCVTVFLNGTQHGRPNDDAVQGLEARVFEGLEGFAHFFESVLQDAYCVRGAAQFADGMLEFGDFADIILVHTHNIET